MIRGFASPQGRYTLRIVVLMTAYVALLILANMLFNVSLAEAPIRWLVAILPALPIIGVFWAIGRLIVELKDEYVRMLLVRQTLFATAIMLSVATAWGFLEDFGLLPHVPAYYAAILWFFALGLVQLVNRWLLREPGC
jgi:hypothetical protein